MRAEIISVGTELLLGEILNTDAEFLARELSELGLEVYHQSVVGDNAERLKALLKTACERSELVILSGGLGPTQDDITKETAAELFGAELALHEESLDAMREYLRARGVEMTENNIKQAMLPENSIVLPNSCGTAPGCIIEREGKTVILLPGPPKELQAMYRSSVRKYLENRTGCIFYSENLKLYGIGESKAAELVGEYIENGVNPTVAPYAEMPGVRLRITAKCADENEGRELIRPIKEKIYEKIGEYIYSDRGETLPEAVVRELIKRKITISAAESCTGGMFASMIVDIDGSSEILSESIVTYSNEAKMKYLGVRSGTLEKYGAVSSETAHEMAEGLAGASGSDIAVGITGIAGPGGGTAEKPVGLVYVGVKVFDDITVSELRLSGGRGDVRRTACMAAFDIIRKKIKNL